MSQKESEKQLQKEDYYNIGKDIISTAGKAPKTCRMGDIYHMIKNRVESMSKYKVQTGRRQQLSPLGRGTSNLKKQLKMIKQSDSEDSFQSGQKDEKLIEEADKLKDDYYKRVRKPISSNVITGQ